MRSESCYWRPNPWMPTLNGWSWPAVVAMTTRTREPVTRIASVGYCWPRLTAGSRRCRRSVILSEPIALRCWRRRSGRCRSGCSWRLHPMAGCAPADSAGLRDWTPRCSAPTLAPSSSDSWSDAAPVVDARSAQVLGNDSPRWRTRWSRRGICQWAWTWRLAVCAKTPSVSRPFPGCRLSPISNVWPAVKIREKRKRIKTQSRCFKNKCGQAISEESKVELQNGHLSAFGEGVTVRREVSILRFLCSWPDDRAPGSAKRGSSSFSSGHMQPALYMLVFSFSASLQSSHHQAVIETTQHGTTFSLIWKWNEPPHLVPW